VLLYGHYDVQPAEPLNEWLSPAFEPTIRDGRIYCRGATDNKGQLIAHVSGLAETLAEHGDLPVNLTILFEGEEEIGSPNLKPFLEAHAEELACDVVAISDTGMVGEGIGTFTYGLRGIACMEVKVHGPSIDLHSGIFGGAIANPVTMAARLVATLHDAEGRVMIPGFYDGVRDLQDWERTSWKGLGDGDAETLSLTGSPALFGEPGYTERERRWARPTAEVNGIGGGYQGEGSKTVIFGGNVALIREGGSIPIVQAFKDVLKADTLLLGLALPDCQAHAPNENFPIANLEAGIRLNQALLRELAR
jgi:acetylornithine deacetylase/succinyl-diaminopimelate desuccinylase-like protein